MKKEKNAKISSLNNDLSSIQATLHDNPMDVGLHESESKCKSLIKRYYKIDEESAFKKKAKHQCISLGDSNSAYFYHLFKVHKNYNTINALRNSNGDFVFEDDVLDEVVSFYKLLLAPQLDPRAKSTITIHRTLS